MKRKNTSASGAVIERKAIARLHADGYAVERARTSTVWIKGKPRNVHVDFFGAFDLIALHPQYGTLLIQVTTKAKMRERERKVAAAVDGFYNPLNAVAQVWGFVGGRRPNGQRFIVTELSCNGPDAWCEAQDEVCVVENKRARAA